MESTPDHFPEESLGGTRFDPLAYEQFTRRRIEEQLCKNGGLQIGDVLIDHAARGAGRRGFGL